MIRIGLTGSHGVGKTTLANAVVSDLESRGIRAQLTPEVPRTICNAVGDNTFFRQGQNTVLKQMLLLFRQIQIEASDAHPATSILVCDRGVLDHWAYTKYFYEEVLRAEGLLELYERFISEYCRTYSALYYVPIEFPPIDDGTRESDDKFQRSIDKIIFEFLHREELDFMTVKGSPTERCDQVVSNIKLTE